MPAKEVIDVTRLGALANLYSQIQSGEVFRDSVVFVDIASNEDVYIYWGPSQIHAGVPTKYALQIELFTQGLVYFRRYINPIITLPGTVLPMPNQNGVAAALVPQFIFYDPTVAGNGNLQFEAQIPGNTIYENMWFKPALNTDYLFRFTNLVAQGVATLTAALTVR